MVAKRRRQAPAKAAPATEQTKFYCRDCLHSYDWHNLSFATGKPIMCRCPFLSHCMLLNDDTCERNTAYTGKVRQGENF